MSSRLPFLYLLGLGLVACSDSQPSSLTFTGNPSVDVVTPSDAGASSNDVSSEDGQVELDTPNVDAETVDVGEELTDAGVTDVTETADVANDVPSVDTSTPDTAVVDASQEDAGTPAIEDPMDLGPYSWTTGNASIDLGGNGFFAQSAELEIYLPEAAGTYPVVIFNHGFQLGPDDYKSYGEHLASWGMVAILPQYPGSLIAPRTHAELRDDLSAIIDWVEDEPAGLQGKADVSKLGLSGHSMGGKISLLFAATDDRASAVFAVDPVDAAPPFSFNPNDYPSVTPELMPDVTAVLAIVGETTNGSGGGFGGACAPADENFQQYYQAATSPAIEVDMLGANHMSFLDNPNCGFACNACPGGTDDPTQTRKLTQRIMIAFFARELAGDASMIGWLTDWENADPATSDLVAIQSKNGF